MEVKRQSHVLDTHLASHEFLAGDRYSFADIAVWLWQPGSLHGAYNANEFPAVEEYPQLLRWYRAIAARPAVVRGRIVNRTSRAPGEFLRERHDASDFTALPGFSQNEKPAFRSTAIGRELAIARRTSPLSAICQQYLEAAAPRSASFRRPSNVH